MNEPAIVETDDTPPAWMEGDALSYWNMHITDLLYAGIISATDKPAFAMVCQRWADWRESRRKCETAGRDMPIKDNNGIIIGARRAPWDVRERDQYEQYFRAARDFGLTPSSRGNVCAIPRDIEEDGSVT